MFELVLGAVVIVAGALIFRFAEPLHRVAPYQHLGSPLGLRAMGIGVVAFGGLWTAIAITQLLLGR